MLIIVDLDGTILDSQQQHLNAFTKALKKCGFYVSKELIKELKDRFGKPGMEIFKEILPNSNEVIIKAVANTAFHILMGEEFDNIKLLPGVDEFFENNKEHVFALATSSNKDFTYKIIERFKLKNKFKVIITKDDIEKAKPDPEILNKAMSEAGFSAKGTVFLGDTIYDYQAAVNAGVRFVGVTIVSYFKTELEKRTECVKTLADFKI
ncbi:MAG: HAD-IA family hydrolase [Nanoarchaeota archaeon]|nr:HAD-IA family hydrolase [Nanoarchaeota archaeon]